MGGDLEAELVGTNDQDEVTYVINGSDGHVGDIGELLSSGGCEAGVRPCDGGSNGGLLILRLSDDSLFGSTPTQYGVPLSLLRQPISDPKWQHLAAWSFDGEETNKRKAARSR